MKKGKENIQDVHDDEHRKTKTDNKEKEIKRLF